MFLFLCIVMFRLITYEIAEHYNKRPIIYLNFLIVLWAVVQISLKVYGIVIYFTVLVKNQKPDMEYFSIRYTKLDMMASFILHTIFLQVFYLYYNGLFNTIQFSELKPFQRKLNQFFKLYYIVRILFKICTQVLIFIYDQLPTITTISSLNIIFTLVDGFMVLFLLIVSYRILSKSFKNFFFQKEQDKAKYLFQYKFIVIICLCRQIIIVLFLKQIRQLILGEQNSKCFDSLQTHISYTIIRIFISSGFNHILPVAWIIKIYNLKDSTILKATMDLSLNQSHQNHIEDILLDIDRQHRERKVDRS